MKFIYYLVFFLLVSALFAAIEGTLFHIRPAVCTVVLRIEIPSGYRTPKYSRLISGKDRRRDSENRKRVLSFFLRLCSRNHQVVFDVEKADDEAYDF